MSVSLVRAAHAERAQSTQMCRIAVASLLGILSLVWACSFFWVLGPLGFVKRSGSWLGQSKIKSYSLWRIGDPSNNSCSNSYLCFVRRGSRERTTNLSAHSYHPPANKVSPLDDLHPQLPFKRPQIPSHRDHKALNRGNLLLVRQ